jgi:ubiquinone/menaquinone biosynthesis C-methylase UbiE
MVAIQPVNTTYEPFSREPEYVEANRGFVGLVNLAHVRRFLDLACGTGAVGQLLLQAAPTAQLNGIDLDPVQIDLATKEFRELGHEVRRGTALTDELVNGKGIVTLAVGSADELPFPDASFDCVTIANAIHMMPDKDRFLEAVSRVLKPGGLFGFNTAFYAGSYPPGTERHMIHWLREATLFIDRLNEQLVAEGKKPIKKQHGTTRAAFQNRWNSPQEWREKLEARGFAIQTVNERVVMFDERCIAAVGAYGGLAEVLMSGYPVEVAAMALQAAAGPSLAAMNVTAVPRNWLEVWAVKPS